MMTYKIKGDVAVDRNLSAPNITATNVTTNLVSSTTSNSSLSTSFGYDEVAQDIVPATATAIVVDLTNPNRKFEILIDNVSTGDVQINSPINSVDDKDHVVFRVTNNDTIARNVVFTALYTRPNNDQVGLFSMAAGTSRVLKAVREGAAAWVVTEDTAYVTPANARAFASNTGVAPVVPGYPSTAEIQTYVTTNSITDTLVYYTGTDAFGDTPTHVYWVDQAGTATAVETTAAVVTRPFGRMELTASTVLAALGVAVNSATVSVAAAFPSVLPFSKITHQEGGIVGTLGTWTDNSAVGQRATGTRMSFTIPTDGAGAYRYSIVTPNAIDGDIATGNAPSYGIAVNGSVAQIFDAKSGDGDITTVSGLITLAAGDVVQPVVVIEGSDAEAFDLGITFGAGSLSGYPTVAGADVVYSYFELEKRSPRDLIDPNMVPVNDASASGYFDIGAMRIQWGTTAGVASLETIAFPVAFANTTYSITFGTEGPEGLVGDSRLFSVQRVGAKTTTGCQIRKRFVEDTTVTADDADINDAITEIVDWMAIGLKP